MRKQVSDIFRCHIAIGIETNAINTKGDQIQDRPLRDIGGKALFVKGLEMALLDGEANEEDVIEAAQIVARYSQGRDADQVEVKVQFPDGEHKKVMVAPMPADQVKDSWRV